MFKFSSVKKAKGFTLVEILVVISIIGILVTILTANFNTARKQARDKSRAVELTELQLALEVYKAQNGVYPAQGCGTVGVQWAGPGPQASWGSSCNEYILGLVPNFINELPTDPVSEGVVEQGFAYRTDASRSSYKVLVHNSVETNVVTSFANEFARCPRDCAISYCNATPQTNVYAVYSVGAVCW